MRISYEWLGEYVDLSDVTPAVAAEKLTMAGLEVTRVTTLDVSQIVIGRVLTQTPHPKSRNPLWIHQVDLGSRTEQIIAGAPNAIPGSLVPVALPGTVVPSGREVRDLTIAGVAGRGMMCSEVELGLGEDGSGIMLLERGEPGEPLSDLFPLEAVLELEVTPNRPDCLCHLGAARELAAALGRDLNRDFMPPFTGGVDPPGTELVRVTIEDRDLCRRYIGAPITGIGVGPSPGWMQRRLRAAGVRPINNVVDITNYVLLEYGQPLHAFDLARLAGPEIRVRRAREGEQLLCLDGMTRSLHADQLVIADAERPVALAGLIGGEESAVGSQTSAVLLESATFDGPNIRTTSRTFNLRTEASLRFAKTLSPELALAGARRAVTLLQQLGGGHVHRDWADVYPRPQEPVRIRLAPARIDAVLGVHVPLEESEAILRRLGFHLRIEEDGVWDVLPPVFRLDVSIPEDVVEEVGRIHGYEHVPATLPGERRSRWEPVHTEHPVTAIREVLVGGGLTEAITPALVSATRLQHLGLAERMVAVANPLSDEMDALRTSLLPGLLEVAANNVNRGSREPRLFEIGRVFERDSQGARPEEPVAVAALALTRDDPEAGREAWFSLKSILDRAAHDASVPHLGYAAQATPAFHPGRTALVLAGSGPVGYLGEVHPRLLREFDLAGRAAAFALNLDALLAARLPRSAKTLPRYPAVERDLSIVVEEPVLAGELLAAIKESAGELLESAIAFKEYRGAPIEAGFKSVTFALTFRSPARTLTDSEVDQATQAIESHVQRRFGARLRGREA